MDLQCRDRARPSHVSPLTEHASDVRRMLRSVNLLDLTQRAVAEFVGAFALLFIGAGAASIYGANDIVAIALGTGLAIAVMVTAVGHISGGHFNPAVTLGFLVTRRIHPVHAVVYWIVQFGGAALAVLMLKWVLPNASSPYGAPSLANVLDKGQGVAVEAVLTFFLVWVIFACAADPRGAFDKIAGLAIGGVITMGTLMAFVLTGAAMNPARAFGPQLVANDWKNWWIWYVGPLAGGVIAAVLYELMYLRSPEPAGMAAQAQAGEELEPEEPAVAASAQPAAINPDEAVEAPKSPAENESPGTDAGQ
jgi:aquaporin Z